MCLFIFLCHKCKSYQCPKYLSHTTNNTYEDVMKIQSDQDFLKELIEKYWFITNDILDSKIYYPLEGYLYPDTYYF